jgi:hypothetical protein
MEMTIDKTIEFFNGLECCTPQAKDARDVAINTMHKYQQLQADYETRLKADIVAALKELQLEIEEIETGGDAWELATKDDCNAVIQKKIDALEYDLERGNDGD